MMMTFRSGLSQRVRVENVTSRLGLVSLAYLWRRDQSTLLQEMIDCGVEAAIIKCAALGLEEWHLGKTLAELQPRLEDLVGNLTVNTHYFLFTLSRVSTALNYVIRYESIYDSQKFSTFFISLK